MRRSAPSEVEGSYLAPCPNCGALNGKTATLCWKCEVELVEPGMDEPAPSLPSFETSGEPVSATQTDATRIDQAPQQTAEAGPIAPGVEPATPEARPAVAPEEDSAPAHGPGSRSARAEAVRRKQLKVIRLATVVLGAAVAVSAYFIYRQRAVGDMAWLPAGSTDVMDRVRPTDPGSRVDATESTGRAPAASMPVATATNAGTADPPLPQSVERSVAAIDRDPPAAVSTAREKAGESTELRASSRSLAALAPARRATTSQRGVSKRTVESSEAAAAIARSTTTRTRTEEPPPPHPGPCTPAVAALGLCTPEPTPRRE